MIAQGLTTMSNQGQDFDLGFLARLAQDDGVQRFTGAGLWSLDPRSGQMAWSSQIFRMLGQSPGLVPGYQAFLEAIHPDDRDRVDQAVRVAAGGEPVADLDLRIVGPGGGVEAALAGGPS